MVHLPNKPPGALHSNARLLHLLRSLQERNVPDYKTEN